jgi:hypothetical protein
MSSSFTQERIDFQIALIKCVDPKLKVEIEGDYFKVSYPKEDPILEEKDEEQRDIKKRKISD